MVNLYFASYRENAHSGWSARLLLMGGDYEEGAPFGAAHDSVSFSGRSESGPEEPLLDVATRVKATQGLRFFLPAGGHVSEKVDIDYLEETVDNRGHPSVEVNWVEFEKDEYQFKTRDILPFLWREARAACWGVPLNNKTYVPGEPISTNKAQSLHIKASNSGFEDGAFRLVLAERGLISAKEVTEANFLEVRRLVGSETIAKIYNRKYREMLNTHPIGLSPDPNK